MKCRQHAGIKLYIGLDLQVLADCEIPRLRKSQFDLISTLNRYRVALLLVFAVALHRHDNKFQLRVPVFPRGM